jgi:hypothetical protein
MRLSGPLAFKPSSLLGIIFIIALPLRTWREKNKAVSGPSTPPEEDEDDEEEKEEVSTGIGAENRDEEEGEDGEGEEHDVVRASYDQPTIHFLRPTRLLPPPLFTLFALY